jgi:GNAT superfamily N-acetyltransferase
MKIDHINFLARAAEESLTNLFIAAAEVKNIPIAHCDYYKWIKNPFSIWYSRIFDIKIPEACLSDVFERLIEQIRAGDIPPNLLIGPTTVPKNLADHLLIKNFKIITQQKAMAIDLTQTNQVNLENASNFKLTCCIKRVNNEKDFHQWLQTVEIAFNKARNYELYRQLFLDKKQEMIFYALYKKNTLATTAMLYINNNAIAGIYLVGTLPQYRNKGFGMKITQQVLQDAREMGCKLAVLQASAMGVNIYKKIGFGEYGEITQWELMD